LETINELLYLFSEYPNVNGETLLEMFLLVKHQATTAATPKPKDAAKVDLILANLAELAREDGAILKKSNGYNDFIEDIRTELLAKEKHMNELRYELKQLSEAIGELDEQKKNLAEAIKAYDDYLKSISDELQRNFKTTMKKFTWKQLTDKKCCIIAGTTLTLAQQKGCKFEITHMSAEEFKVKGKVALFSQEFKIKMSDLLDAKDSGELAYDTGQGVVLDVAATLVFLNAKFFNKKRKYVSAK
jgi:tetratricopeptide (TPR) repeat protein